MTRLRVIALSAFQFRYPASAIAAERRLTADDILLLRKHMFPNGLTSDEDADQLFALHRLEQEKCEGWNNWFVEMLAAYVVVSMWPHYDLDQGNADWLVARIAAQGVIHTGAEVELLLHVMEIAQTVPVSLSVLAVNQLCLGMKTAKGAYAENRKAKRAGLSAADMEYLFRILRRTTQSGTMIVDPQEVAALEAVETVVASRSNHPSFRILMRSLREREPMTRSDKGPWLKPKSSGNSLVAAA